MNFFLGQLFVHVQMSRGSYLYVSVALSPPLKLQLQLYLELISLPGLSNSSSHFGEGHSFPSSLFSLISPTFPHLGASLHIPFPWNKVNL